MNKDLQISVIKYLERQDDLVFFYLFGSILTSKVFRDIDVAVYFRDGSYDLLRLGELVSEIEAISSLKTDIVSLNNLYTKNPAFAHEIASTGKLGYFSGDPSPVDKTIWVNFKVNCIKYYEDTQILRKISRSALLNRVESGNLGKRNYAN